ncbi:t-SNARE [Mycotypha africana]|uniref:t-SNARE n=1 Tax=Mycotypha africana TaxID=64632 RepID=UPI002301E32D|nr:t-SNARE [Mycotypha africana]KAI8982363.1 t-SNARE [Mycotypha africana]
MRDRTSEFIALVERIKKRNALKRSNNNSPTIEKSQRQANNASRSSEFSRMASQLSRQIATTSEKLEQLTYLTKLHHGLNDTTTTEITASIEISYKTLQQEIKQDITKLNQHLNILESVKNGTRPNSKQAGEHSNNVILSLQNQLAKTSLGFKDVLESEVETRQQSSSPPQQQPRRRMNVTSVAPPYTPSPQLSVSGSTLLDDSPQSLGIPMIAPQQQLLLEQEQQHQLQERHINIRSNAIESIESTIAELGGIFQQLARMVAEQRETIQRIDQNTDDIEMNVMGAQTELMKYYRNISTNRSLFLKIFATIIFFFILFTYIM